MYRIRHGGVPLLISFRLQIPHLLIESSHGMSGVGLGHLDHLLNNFDQRFERRSVGCERDPPISTVEETLEAGLPGARPGRRL